MALTQNTALRTALADSFADLWDGGTMEIRTSGGTTLLASIALPSPAFGAAASGSVAKSGTWSDASANASGVARLGRLISADTLKTCDISIGESGSGADAIIDDEDVVSGGVVTINTFVYTVPAS